MRLGSQFLDQVPVRIETAMPEDRPVLVPDGVVGKCDQSRFFDFVACLVRPGDLEVGVDMLLPRGEGHVVGGDTVLS